MDGVALEDNVLLRKELDDVMAELVHAMDRAADAHLQYRHVQIGPDAGDAAVRALLRRAEHRAGAADLQVRLGEIKAGAEPRLALQHSQSLERLITQSRDRRMHHVRVRLSARQRARRKHLGGRSRCTSRRTSRWPISVNISANILACADDLPTRPRS